MSEVIGMPSNKAQMHREVSDRPAAADAQRPAVDASVGRSAGALLRQAREAKGLHIAALAVSLKVPQRKLEALEADRYDELTDATFVRALAQTVCRMLKVDPVPVLALLPQTLDTTLGRVAGGLNQPFRERPGREELKRLAWLWRPGPLVAAALLLATAVVYLAPANLWSIFGGAAGDRVTPDVLAASSVSESMFPPGVIAPGNAEPAAAPVTPASAAHASAASVSGPLQLRANAQTWVEVRDANDQTLMSRNLDRGEELTLDGVLPLKVKIGNAAGVAVQFRGQAVDLTAATHANVAQLELK